MDDITTLEQIPIEKLNISVGTYLCLKRYGIETIGDLIELNINDLYKIRNLFFSRYDEVITKVHDFGLYFKDEKKL